MRRRWLTIAVPVLAGACLEPERAPRADAGDDADTEVPMVDSAEIEALRTDYREVLVELSDEPERSQTHPDAVAVTVWGSADAAASFAAIDAMDPTQSIGFAPGTAFVKEHLDASDAVIGITLMFKGPAGLDPEFGDWYWLRTRGDDITHAGHVDLCIDCHDAAINTDFVVGFGKSG